MKNRIVLFLISVFTSHQIFCSETALPELRFGEYKNGSMVPLSFKKYIPDFVWLADSSGNEIPSTVIESGIIEVTGVTSQGHILEGGELSQDAHRVIESAKAGKILIQVNIRNSVSNNIDTIRMMLMFGLTPEVLITGIQNGREMLIL